MKKKKLFYSILICVLFLTIGIAIFIIGDWNENTSSTEAHETEKSEKTTTPSPIHYGWKQEESGDSQSPRYNFRIPEGFGHVKLWFSNKGKDDVVITVQHDDPHKPYAVLKLKPGQEETWLSAKEFPQGMLAGDYIIQFGSAGANVQMEHGGFAADTLEKLFAYDPAQLYTKSINFITPTSSWNEWNQIVSNSPKSTQAVIVPKGFGHMKLWFSNKGESDATVVVQHIESKKEYALLTIKAGKEEIWFSGSDFPSGMRAGVYSLSFYSTKGNLHVEHAGLASHINYAPES
jgi:hypothetical protein